MSVKTIERVTHVPNNLKLWGADTVGTRVVYDSEYSEFCVYFYIDSVRHPDHDYYTNDKDDAIGTAKAMRNTYNNV